MQALAKSQDLYRTSGFSIGIPITLLVSTVLKLHFWFGSMFSIVLLAQCLLLACVQAFILFLCFSKAPPRGIILAYKFRVKGVDVLTWMLIFAIFISYFTFQLSASPSFSEFLGNISALVESSIALPQILQNYHRKSVAGFSSFLLYCWLTGDVLKTAYFIYADAPPQFLLTSALQLLLDAVLFCQFLLYDGFPVLFAADRKRAADAAASPISV